MRGLCGQRVTINGHTLTGIPSANFGDLWTPGGSIPQPPGGGQQLAFKSTSANDTNAAGTGARQIRLHYVNALGVHTVELVNLNGLTLQNTVATNIFRILGTSIITVGSGGSPAGNILLRDVGDTTTFWQHDLGFNVSTVGAYTVPSTDRNGDTVSTLTVDEIRAQSNFTAGTTLTCHLLVEADPNNTLPLLTSGIFYPFYSWQMVAGTEFGRRGLALPPIPALATVKVTVKASNAAAALACSFTGILN